MASAKNTSKSHAQSHSRGSKTTAQKAQHHPGGSKGQEKSQSAPRSTGRKAAEAKHERPQPRTQKSASHKSAPTPAKGRSHASAAKQSRAKTTPETKSRQKGRQQGQTEGGQSNASGPQDTASSVTRVAKQHPLATAATAAVGAAGLGLVLAQGVRKYMKGGRQEGDNSEQDRGGRDDFGGGEESENYDDRRDQGDEDEGAEPQMSGNEADDSDDESDEEGEEDADEDDQSPDAQMNEESDEEAGEESGFGNRISALTRRAESGIRHGAMAVGHAAHEGFERGKEIIAPQWDAHPLMICAAALAVGAAAGMLLPSTELEDRLMGSAADRVNDRIREATGGAVSRGRRVVTSAIRQATDAVAREAEREGLTPDRLGRKISRLVGHVRQAVTDAVEDA